LPISYGKPGYHIHADTKRVFLRLTARGRSQRVYEVDKQGCAWIRCRFRRKDGTYENHLLGLYESEMNWRVVRLKAGKRGGLVN
jgi:hypothetical protein